VKEISLRAHNSIAEHIQLLRSRVARYKSLAETLYDHRIAAEVAGFANELETELLNLERWQYSPVIGNIGGTALAS
jgi:hypothetical protein